MAEDMTACLEYKDCNNSKQQQQEPKSGLGKKGCGSQIFFDEDRRTENGKWIPIDKDTDEPHQCERSGAQEQDEQ